MQRRGVSRDALVGCLREMGREMPLASVRMLQVCSRMYGGAPTDLLLCQLFHDLAYQCTPLRKFCRGRAQQHRHVQCLILPCPACACVQWAARRGMNVTILSDCNQTFM